MYKYSNIVLVSLFIIFSLNCVNGFGWENIETGYVGVRYVWNEIKPPLLEPGWNSYNKISSTIVKIETRPQTDEVLDVPCGTNDGVQVTIRRIEIGNQLDQKYVLKVVSEYGPNYDKYLVTDLIKAQITIICSKMSAQQVAIDNFDVIDDKLLKFMTKSIATIPLSLNEYLESFIFIFVGLSLCKQYQISVSSQTLHLITIFVTSQLIEILF